LTKIENSCLKNNGFLQTFAANYQKETLNVESGPVDLDILNSLLLDPNFDDSLLNILNKNTTIDNPKKRKEQETSNANAEPAFKRQEKELIVIENPFDLAFQQFMEVYNKLSNEERASKIRSVSKKLPSKDAESFTELLDSYLFESKSTKKTNKSNGSSTSTCDCEDCPHKKELERIDEFWGTVMTTPFPTNNANTIIS
jgi:hypothetical protein